MTKQDILEYCLGDAYALEQGSARLLKTIQGQPGNTRELDDQLGAWAQESETSAKQIRDCIQALGGQPSTDAGMSPRLVAALEPIVAAGLPDQQVKNGALLHGLMHFGHAQALALARGGEVLGEPQVSQLAQQLADQKAAAARWLEQHIAAIWDAFREQQLDEPADASAADTGAKSSAAGTSASSGRRPAMTFAERLDDKTRDELSQMAKDRGIAYSNKNRDELIAELKRSEDTK